MQLQNQGQLLDLEERMVHPQSPLRAAILAHLWPSMPATATFFFDSDDEAEHLAGMVQTRARPGRPEQDVVFLAPALSEGNGSHATWQRLLAHACVKAGEMGHHRVYARAMKGGDAVQIFKHVGFLVYAEEEIYALALEDFPNNGQDRLGLRKQTTADSWSLQRLYAVVTPRGVQVAEGLAQGQWQLKGRFPGSRGGQSGYVWEREGEILAVLHIRFGRAGYGLRMLIHPDVSDQTGALIEAGLCLIRASGRPKAIYSSIRTYQSEIGNYLLDYGLKPVATQVVMVKHITVRARDFLSRLVAFETPVEAKAATPTPFLNAERPQPANGGLVTKKTVKNSI